MPNTEEQLAKMLAELTGGEKEPPAILDYTFREDSEDTRINVARRYRLPDSMAKYITGDSFGQQLKSAAELKAGLQEIQRTHEQDNIDNLHLDYVPDPEEEKKAKHNAAMKKFIQNMNDSMSFGSRGYW